MGVMLCLELFVLFLILFLINYDVKSKPLDRKVFYVWVVGTAIGYYFYRFYGVLLVIVVYFLWTRALLRRWDLD